MVTGPLGAVIDDVTSTSVPIVGQIADPVTRNIVGLVCPGWTIPLTLRIVMEQAMVVVRSLY